jgi:threonine aldolase
MTKKVCLASDNFAPAHPYILQAVAEANTDFAPSYGSDSWTEKSSSLIAEAMGSPCKVLITSSGTGANVLALKLMCRRHESVICTDSAHINFQEAGAAESIVGCKLLAIPHTLGKMDPEALLKKVKNERLFGKHTTSSKVVSITQPTEYGTVYTLEELKALSKICREEKLLLHIDGSRLYNAAVFLNTSLKSIVDAASPDIISLGGTKNGLLCTESLVIFNKDLQEGSDYMHKQTLQLVSKMRFLSSQYIPFFQNDLWKTLASQANQKTQSLADILKNTLGVQLSYPVETNQIFFTVPKPWIPHIQEKITCFLMNQEKNEIRFVTSWNTSEDDITAVRQVFSELTP